MMEEEDGIRLRARRRKSQSHDAAAANLFVRLAPSTARRLGDPAARPRLPAPARTRNDDDGPSSSPALRNHHHRNDNDGNYTGWSLLRDTSASRRCRSGIEFLPLSIRRICNERSPDNVASSQTVVYASYNGGDLAAAADTTGEDEDDCIELPDCIFSSLFSNDENQSDGDSMWVVVQVLAPSAVHDATRVSVEPVTVEDWELLQLDAAWLEGGGLLRQVSLVYPNQVVPLRLSGSDVARVRVMPGDTLERTAVWPGEDDGECCCCWRLRADTEIVVTPKPRPSTTTAEIILRTFPCRQDYCYTEEEDDDDDAPSTPSAMLELAALLDQTLVSVVAPNTVVLHPSTLVRLQANDDILADEDGDATLIMIAEVRLIDSNTGAPDSEERPPETTAIVGVTTSTAVPEDCMVVHPLVRLKLKARRRNNKVGIRLWCRTEIARARIRDRDQLGSSQLYLQKAKVQHIPTDIATWRSPDTTGSFYGALPVFCRRDELEHQRPLARDVLSAIPTTVDTPLEIGGFLLLPSGVLYRLAQEQHDTNDRSIHLGKKFALAGDLPKLLTEPTLRDAEMLSSEDAMYYHSPSSLKDDVVVVDCPTPIDSAAVLPPKSVFSSSLKSMIESAANHAVVFVQGELGTGKTHTALTIAAAIELTKGSSTLYLDCRQLRDSRVVRMKTILDEISKVFEEACSALPCVVILDELDELIPSFSESGVSDDSVQAQQVNPVEMDQAKLIADVTRHILSSSISAFRQVSVVVTCKSAEALSETLLSDTEVTGCTIAVPNFGASDREALFCSMLQRFASTASMTWGNSRTVSDFGQKTRGFRPRDIEQLTLRVCKRLKSPADDIENVTAKELETFVPLARLGVAEETVTNMSWSDIGGMFQAKSELTSAILRPSLYRRIYEKSKIRLPRGILLYGYPGTGKTLCVPALAKECGFPLIMCRGPELLDKYIGASEAKVRELFNRAASAAPSILFLDELDSLAPPRGSDHTGVTDRVVNQLLTFLDGVEDTSQSGQVYVVAATTRPDKIDPALLRPGRLEKHVFVGFAQDLDEWTDLLSQIAARFKLDPDAKDSILSGQFIRTAQSQSDSFHLLSAADLKAVFCAARLTAVHEALAEGRTNDAVSIRYDQLMDAFLRARPSLSPADYQQLRSVYSVYNSSELLSQASQSAADAASGSRPARPHGPPQQQRVALK